MEFVMLSRKSLTLFTNRKLRFSLKLSKMFSKRELQIACQNHRSKRLNFHYRYPISYKNAKKANPEKGFTLDKSMHQINEKL